MEEWVYRALQKWPNVPALYGWLKLDRRGRWLIKGEEITRPQIIDVINRNYAADDRGAWFFQNGPQRGYMQLEYAPFILRASGDDHLTTHTGLDVQRLDEIAMDEDGALLFRTEHGAGALIDDELEWALQRLRVNDQPIDEKQLDETLALPSGSATSFVFEWRGSKIPVIRVDASAAPARYQFVRDPQPL